MKKISKALKGLVDKARASDAYWIEAAKLHFAVSLDQQRQRSGLTYKSVAEKLGTSAAYISKVFRGDTNVTLESMVKLARATGGRVEVRVVDEQAAAFSWQVEECIQAFEQSSAAKQGNVAKPSATIIDFPTATNEDAFQYRWAA